MLFDLHVPPDPAYVHPSATAVLLVEADPNARARHQAALASAGYSITAMAACPDADEVADAALVLSDVPSFHWLQEQRFRRLPPVVVLAEDDRAGVTACLCGASEWIPIEGEPVYLLATVRAVLHSGSPVPPRDGPPRAMPGHRHEYRLGDHVCAIHDTADEQLEVAAHFIGEGLKRNERCLYVGRSPDGLGRFRLALERAGGDPAAGELSGALLLLTADGVYLLGGRFDGGRMLRMLREGVDAALTAGFSGLRTCGDMSWLLDEAPGSHQVVEYEGLLNGFFAGGRALGMCQYHRADLPGRLLHAALATHGSVAVDDHHVRNPFYRQWPFDDGDSPPPGDLDSMLARLRTPGR